MTSLVGSSKQPSERGDTDTDTMAAELKWWMAHGWIAIRSLARIDGGFVGC